jgi:NTP pyrophosphatase (non-canonical NTP hydrolase)
MTKQEHLLSCLAEECAEIAQEVSKALRFGLDNVWPDARGDRTVREKIVSEFYDLLGVVDTLEDEGILQINAAKQSAARAAKRAKLLQFLEYARQQGALR